MKNTDALTLTYGDLLTMQERFVKAAEAGVDFTRDDINLLSRVESKLAEFKFMEAAIEYVKIVTNEDLSLHHISQESLKRLFREYNLQKVKSRNVLSWEDFFVEVLGDDPFKERGEDDADTVVLPLSDFDKVE